MLIFNDFNTFLGQASEYMPDLLPRCEFVVSPALWSPQNFLSAVTIAGKKAGQRFEADSASNAQGLVPPALCLCCYDVESVRSPVRPGMTGRIRYELFTRLFMETKFVYLFIKIKQIFGHESCSEAPQRAFLEIIRILFRYADIVTELCSMFN